MKKFDYSQERKNIEFNMERSETYEEFMRLSQMLDLLDNKIEFMKFIESLADPDMLSDHYINAKPRSLRDDQTKKLVISNAPNSKNNVCKDTAGKKPVHKYY